MFLVNTVFLGGGSAPTGEIGGILRWLFLLALAGFLLLGCTGSGMEGTDEQPDSQWAVSTDDSDGRSDTGSVLPVECVVTLIEARLSPVISTVGIVRWSTTLADVVEAHIDFGPDATYGLTAPVDLREPDFATLLLGMKEDSGPYHFRIVVSSQEHACASIDFSFDRKTAARPTDLEKPDLHTFGAKDALAGGYLIGTEFRDNIDTPSDYAFILDAEGDLVWWYRPADFGDLTTARMSYDGRYMWLGHGNVPNLEGRMGRVRMDGTEWTDLRQQFLWLHHHFTVLPDETVAYLSYNQNECDDIIERTPDGTQRVLMNSAQALGNPVVCHGNAIQYSPFDDTYVVSDTNFDAYFKIDRNGKLLWVLNGGILNDFDKDGGGATGWTANHNFHLLDANRILFFNNGVYNTPNDHIPAVVREIVIDVDNMTTEEVWTYQSQKPIESQYLGDVQRLPNGNTIIAYSASGIVHEVNAKGELLQEIDFQQEAIGYISKRATLYGPPPR